MERHCSLDRGTPAINREIDQSGPSPSGMLARSSILARESFDASARSSLPRGDLLSASSFPSAMETIPIFYDAGSRLFYLHYRRRGPANGVIPRGKLRPYTTTRCETDAAVTAVYDTPSYFSLYITTPRCPSLLRHLSFLRR